MVSPLPFVQFITSVSQGTAPPILQKDPVLGQSAPEVRSDRRMRTLELASQRYDDQRINKTAISGSNGRRNLSHPASYIQIHQILNDSLTSSTSGVQHALKAKRSKGRCLQHASKAAGSKMRDALIRMYICHTSLPDSCQLTMHTVHNAESKL